tara:strand:- start:23 stop:685 length:663 start_codon:yes stop_codon:yes gene_type:complete
MKFQVKNSDRRLLESIVWLKSFLLSTMVHISFFFLWWGEEVPQNVSMATQSFEGSGDSKPFGRIEWIRIQSTSREAELRPIVPLLELEISLAIEIEDTPIIEGTQILSKDLNEFHSGLFGDQLSAEENDMGDNSDRTVPPLPRNIVIPQFIEDQDLEEIEVGVFVDEGGRVVPDSIRFVTPIYNDNIRKQLIEKAAEWIFDPATAAGKPVGSWFFYTIRM